MFKDKRVLIKPNLLSAHAPETAVVTHPEFFRAVLQVVCEEGGKPILVESPAVQHLGKVLEKAGYDRILREEGCEVADTRKTSVLFHEGGKGYRRFELANALFDADTVVNLPKFKTHSLTYMTGAVKNLFGLIHGLDKSKWHVKAPTSEAFSGFLLDLYEALLRGFERPKTFIHIMDAILGMEGEGPGRKGQPRKIGAMILGQDALAVDAVAVDLLGLNPRKVPTLVLGAKRGLGETLLERISITGQKYEDFDVRDFVPSKSKNRFDMGRWPLNTTFFKNLFVERPVPSGDLCSLCYQCMTICPGKAIGRAENNGRIPRYDYEKCIRCYCCMEICPEAAIRLKPGRLQWVLEKF
ncbi:MAG: DUF362 domain-containing protein [Desulfatiglandales bacterium]